MSWKTLHVLKAMQTVMLLVTYVLLPLTNLVTAVQSLSADKHASNSQGSNPTVDLGYAKYRGVRLEAGIDQFLGMRYSKPPLGNLRFRAPQDPTPERSIQNASKFGPVCVGTGQAVGPGLAEDCLFVNVFRPSSATDNSKLPVWVYIQGGGYNANANANYNGTEVIRQSGNNLVFVNFNYRVGAFGFLASEKVRQDGNLNAGLLDQRKLLNWVRDNIKKVGNAPNREGRKYSRGIQLLTALSLGGDPDHVVIHGASAGAGSVTYHLTAYGAMENNRLFAGAVIESPFWPTQRTVAEMEFQYERLLQTVNCSALDCLRSVDVEKFMAASLIYAFPGAASSNTLPLWYWLPVVDGGLIMDRLYRVFDQGKFIRVPVLVGYDTNEGSLFGYNAATAADVTRFINSNYPHLTSTQLESISQHYPRVEPLPKHAAYFPSASAAYGDSAFTCPGSKIASAVARRFDPGRAWSYRFNVLDPDTVANGLGVPHIFETTAIFAVGYANQAAASYSTTNAGIIPITMRYFISFVRSLNPNTFKDASAPKWSALGWGAGQRLRLQTNNTMMEAVPQDLARKCALWESLADTMET